MASGELLTEREGGTLRVTLNRPEALNALTGGMLSGLSEALKLAEKDPSVRCLVLGASGRAFCSGADLADLKAQYEKGAPDLGEELRRRFNPLALRIRALEKPVLCAIQGVAAGAGASLALACDLKLCSDKAKFLSAFISVGLVPDTGFSTWSVRHLGLSRALEYAWTAKPLHAEEALRAGLVNAVLPAEELAAAVAALARRLEEAPPRAVALTKRLLNRALEQGLAAQMEYEAQLQEILGRSRDHREGVAAFVEGRKAVFTGE